MDTLHVQGTAAVQKGQHTSTIHPPQGTTYVACTAGGREERRTAHRPARKPRWACERVASQTTRQCHKEVHHPRSKRSEEAPYGDVTQKTVMRSGACHMLSVCDFHCNVSRARLTPETICMLGLHMHRSKLPCCNCSYSLSHICKGPLNIAPHTSAVEQRLLTLGCQINHILADKIQ